ncbi:MAG: ribonuclease HII [Rhodospirillaceae bacterium]|nr:MAG: ribonuclease HII [Rhodospirillaceae bacterium]
MPLPRKPRRCTFDHEQAILDRRPGAAIAGVDEAGRGPLAGPVVAAAVILPADSLPDALVAGLDDSKKLSATRRAALYELMMHCPGLAYGVGRAEVEEIDRINILNATHCAMERAVAALPRRADIALVDGNRAPPMAIPVQTLVGGDGLSLSIAAASIIAKVTRDLLMCELDRKYPGYGWHANMGYGTAEHCAALVRLGVTPHHRRSFAPVREALAIG